MKFPNGHTGKQVFFKGKGRKGNKKLDKYQRMLLAAERTNGFEDEPKQPKPNHTGRKRHAVPKITVLPHSGLTRYELVKLRLDKRTRSGV